jgi:hypothetical protein
MLTHSITTLVNSKIYRFISRSLNQIGYSEFSIYGYIAFGDVPSALVTPSRVNATETSISLTWTAPTESDLTVTGYILNMDDGSNTDLLPIYIGKNKPDVLKFEIGGLTKGLPYRFSV